MTDTPNMVCPRCNTFQPKAEVCNKCGVIIAKADKAISGSDEKLSVTESSKPSKAKYGLLLLIAIPCIVLILYFGTADENEEVVTAETKEIQKSNNAKPVNRVTAFNSAATRAQRTKVASKLQTLKTKLYFYTSEGGLPPDNEEGLQELVDTGHMTKADITDAWGNTYVYRMEWGKETPWGKEYKIFVHSKGADGISGNADDVMMP